MTGVSHQGKLMILYCDKKHEEASSKSVLANTKLLRDILEGIRSSYSWNKLHESGHQADFQGGRSSFLNGDMTKPAQILLCHFGAMLYEG
jgi:hypothetical protein